MVASEKLKARAEFARLFNAELDAKTNVPAKHGRVAWVHKHLKDKDHKELVTYEQVRKYIRGVDMPEQANLWIICQRLKLDWARLGPAVVESPTDHWGRIMWELWPRLDEDTRRDFVGAARLKVKPEVSGPFRKDPENQVVPVRPRSVHSAS